MATAGRTAGCTAKTARSRIRRPSLRAARPRSRADGRRAQAALHAAERCIEIARSVRRDCQAAARISLSARTAIVRERSHCSTAAAQARPARATGRPSARRGATRPVRRHLAALTGRSSTARGMRRTSCSGSRGRSLARARAWHERPPQRGGSIPVPEPRAPSRWPDAAASRWAAPARRARDSPRILSSRWHRLPSGSDSAASPARWKSRPAAAGGATRSIHGSAIALRSLGSACPLAGNSNIRRCSLDGAGAPAVATALRSFSPSDASCGARHELQALYGARTADLQRDARGVFRQRDLLIARR